MDVADFGTIMFCMLFASSAMCFFFGRAYERNVQAMKRFAEQVERDWR